MNDWFEETGEAYDEMAERHSQEAAEFGEEVAGQVEEAVNGVLSQMADDLAAKTDEFNEQLNGALEELFAAEDEAMDQIYELVHPEPDTVEWLSLAKRTESADYDACEAYKDDVRV